MKALLTFTAVTISMANAGKCFGNGNFVCTFHELTNVAYDSQRI